MGDVEFENDELQYEDGKMTRNKLTEYEDKEKIRCKNQRSWIKTKLGKEERRDKWQNQKENKPLKSLSRFTKN